jgi:hypothetical protein
VPGSEIGVTEQARDWFYAPAGRRQARVTTYRRLRGYRHHNSATARALARHLRSEGFQSVDIDPGDPGAAGLIAAQVRDRGPDVRSGLALGLVNTGRGDHWTAATVRLGPSEPWGKGLAAQRGAHEPYSLGGGSQPETLLAVGGEYSVDSVRGHQLGEFPAAGAISPASTLDTAVRVIPGKTSSSHATADDSKSWLPGGRTASGQPIGTYAPTSPKRSTVTEPGFDNGHARLTACPPPGRLPRRSAREPCSSRA